ncbi:FkbM family methyltransferase [Ottowia thiooxydans]|uniref:FkbM family methyltransferase n=1 Tax=Ottowia thiooxydans TaxID=219182 RepID=UPI0003FA5A8B|nr:FkbM family methyltransferase [Ottowia thiooxydans]
MAYQLTEARHGRFLVNENDTYVGRSLRTYGEWSEAEIWLFQQILRPGDIVIEAGANIGSHTVFMSRAVGEKGSVYAFEAARLTHQLLCANLALNECFNVHALHKAVGRATQVTRFPKLDPLAAQNFGGLSLREVQTQAIESTEQVEMIHLDGLQLPKVDFIKADIEGFELEMLAGAGDTLEKHRPIVYLEIDFANGRPTGNRDELVEFVEALGYAAFYFIAPMFNGNNFKGAEQNIFHAASIDLICVPQDRCTVTGLTPAHIGDTSIHADLSKLELSYAVLPWDGARLIRQPALASG